MDAEDPSVPPYDDKQLNTSFDADADDAFLSTLDVDAMVQSLYSPLMLAWVVTARLLRITQINQHKGKERATGATAQAGPATNDLSTVRIPFRGASVLLLLTTTTTFFSGPPRS
jgi:hypothetical protein